MSDFSRDQLSAIRAAVANLADGYALFDSDDNLLVWNEAYESLNTMVRDLVVEGASFESLIRAIVGRGQIPDAVGHEQQWIEERVRVRRSGGENVERQVQVNDGRWFLVRECATPDGGVVGTWCNITESKRAEVALRDSERKYRQASQIANLGHWIWDELEDKCVHCSEEHANIYGVSVDEYLLRASSTEKFLNWHHPDDRDRYKNVTDQAVADCAGYETTARIIRKDGEVRWLHELTRPILDDCGRLVQTVGVLQDITEQKLAEEQLLQTQRMEAIGQLTGGVAHDFNNLLGIILGNVQLLENKLEDDDLRDLLRPVIGATKRGAELTSRLLAFSRQQPLQPKAIDIGALCKRMIILLRRTLGETVQIDLRVRKFSIARADSGQLENALLNLCINARDAMPDGGKLTIETENVTLTEADMGMHLDGQSGDYTVLKVSDTGTGIAPEVLEKVFEPFFTTKDVGAGSGLGLSMVYGFAQQSGGHVTIESEEGHGTSVMIYLPQAETASEDAQEKAVDQAIPRGQGETVLVVEDEPALRQVTIRQLEDLGYKTLQAPDGPAALEVLAGSPEVDLLLSDVVLPGGMCGPEIYTKAKEQHSDLKCILVSGYSATLEGTLPDGVDMLSKPFDIADLAKKLRSALVARWRTQTPGAYGTRDWANIMNSRRLLIVDDEPEFGKFVCNVAEEMDIEVRVTTQAEHFKEAYDSFNPTVIVMDVVMPDTDGIDLVTWLADRNYQGNLVIVTGFSPHYADTARTLSVAKGMTSVTTLYKPVDLANLCTALA